MFGYRIVKTNLRARMEEERKELSKHSLAVKALHEDILENPNKFITKNDEALRALYGDDGFKIIQEFQSVLKDIDNVLQQYQDLDPTFKFLGALPSDFYRLTHVDYSRIFDHKRIGIVFNLDTHNEPGSHWVSFLIDNKKKTLEYYDSAGRIPNKNIQMFIDRVDHYLKQYNLAYKTHYNTVKHQLQNNECGVYAIYFMIQRLLGKDFNEIIKNIELEKK